jgi:hypothetical protein
MLYGSKTLPILTFLRFWVNNMTSMDFGFNNGSVPAVYVIHVPYDAIVMGPAFNVPICSKVVSNFV